jgi:hypothetical protein
MADAGDIVAANLRSPGIRRNVRHKEPLTTHLPSFTPHEVGDRAAYPLTGRKKTQQSLVTRNHQTMTRLDQPGNLIGQHQSILQRAHAASDTNWCSSWASMRSFFTK